jgi:hypothetical protein
MVTGRRFAISKMGTNKRDRCYHTMARDLSARPHEILNLKIKDIVFKAIGDKQHAEVFTTLQKFSSRINGTLLEKIISSFILLLGNIRKIFTGIDSTEFKKDN